MPQTCTLPGPSSRAGSESEVGAGPGWWARSSPLSPCRRPLASAATEARQAGLPSLSTAIAGGSRPGLPGAASGSGTWARARDPDRTLPRGPGAARGCRALPGPARPVRPDRAHLAMAVPAPPRAISGRGRGCRWGRERGARSGGREPGSAGPDLARRGHLAAQSPAQRRPAVGAPRAGPRAPGPPGPPGPPTPPQPSRQAARGRAGAAQAPPRFRPALARPHPAPRRGGKMAAAASRRR